MVVDSKKWEDFDLIRNILSELALPTLVLALSFYFSSYVYRVIVFIIGLILFIIISKYRLKFDLNIFSGAYKYSSTNDNKYLKEIIGKRTNEEKYKINLKLHIIYAWIFTAFTIGLPLFLSSSGNLLSSPPIHSDLISLDSVLLIVASIFIALMSQFLNKFKLYKQLSSLLPFTCLVVTAIISMMALIFGEIYTGLIFTIFSIYLLYTLMGSFLFYIKLVPNNLKPLKSAK